MTFITNAKWHLLKLFKVLFLWRNPHISIGRYTYGLPIVLFGSAEGTSLKIGKYCSIPHKRMTIMLGGEHRIDWISTFPFSQELQCSELPCTQHSKGNVTIGNDVWFGINCTVMSGVTIGNGAVVAAHALVVKDVPPYAIVGGVPAKVIAYRFSRETIDKLSQIEWWDWEASKIKKASPLLTKSNIEVFFKKYLNEKNH